MTIQEAMDTIKANPESFPSGLETCYLDVMRFKVRGELNKEIEKFRVASDRFVRQALSLDAATDAEMREAYNDVKDTLNEVNNCWCGHFSPND